MKFMMIGLIDVVVGNPMKNRIIVAYATNRDVGFQKFFKKEVKKSIGCDFEICPIPNNGSVSLTKTYNKFWEGYPFDEHDIFLFIHHDIHFKNVGWGKNLLNLFNESDANIIGVAGTDHLYNHGVWWLDQSGQFNQKDLWGKVWHTDGKKNWKSDFTTPIKKCERLQSVAAIDGVFIAFDPDECEQFDEDFESFHFYDLSFCLRNLASGRSIYVTETIPIIHESEGPVNEIWDQNRQQLILKYPGDHTPNIIP